MRLAKLIELAHRQGHRQWSKVGARIGVSHSEYEYLRAIQDQEDEKKHEDNHGQHLKDVVDELGVRKASASAMVIKLEERGLVVRFPCQFDSRAQHIVLTEQGLRLLVSGEQIYEAAAQTLITELLDLDIKALESEIRQQRQRD